MAKQFVYEFILFNEVRIEVVSRPVEYHSDGVFVGKNTIGMVFHEVPASWPRPEGACPRVAANRVNREPRTYNERDRGSRSRRQPDGRAFRRPCSDGTLARLSHDLRGLRHRPAVADAHGGGALAAHR